jgi:hypothetical protein
MYNVSMSCQCQIQILDMSSIRSVGPIKIEIIFLIHLGIWC